MDGWMERVVIGYIFLGSERVMRKMGENGGAGDVGWLVG